MVSFAARDVGPHPEERGRRKSSANSNARARVSKDEDVRLFALMLRDASQRIWALEAPALASRCDAPQHEGEGGAAHFGETKPTGMLPIGVVPARGTRDSKSAFTRVCDALCVAGTPLRGPMITASGNGSRLSLRSAGTTIALVQAKHQPAAVRNDGRGNFIVLGLLFTMTFATQTCRAAGTHVTPHISPPMCHHAS
jgi:hypothetical protein